MAGVTSHGVTFLRPGEIRHAGIGETAMGPYKGIDEDDVIGVRDIFEEAGVRTRISQDIRRDLWLKAIVNAGINPLAALTRLRNGYLASITTLAAALTAITAEAAAVARAEIESITGAILRGAERRGLRAPMNNLVYGLVRGLERSYQVE